MASGSSGLCAFSSSGAVVVRGRSASREAAKKAHHAGERQAASLRCRSRTDGAVPPRPSKKLKLVREVQKASDEVRRLPRKQQRKVVEMVTAFVEMYKRKAS